MPGFSPGEAQAGAATMHRSARTSPAQESGQRRAQTDIRRARNIPGGGSGRGHNLDRTAAHADAASGFPQRRLEFVGYVAEPSDGRVGLGPLIRI